MCVCNFCVNVCKQYKSVYIYSIHIILSVQEIKISEEDLKSIPGEIVISTSLLNLILNGKETD